MHRLLFLCVPLCLWLSLAPGMAQETTDTAADLLAVDRALSVLTDPDRRDRLVAELERLSGPAEEAADAPPSIPERVADGIGRIAAALPGRERLVELRDGLAAAAADLSARLRDGRPLLPEGGFLALALPGWALAALVWYGTARWIAPRRARVAAMACRRGSWRRALFLLLRHAVLSALPVALGAVVLAVWPPLFGGLSADVFLLLALPVLAGGLAVAGAGVAYLILAMIARRPAPVPGMALGWAAAAALAARMAEGAEGRAALGPSLAALAALLLDIAAAVLALVTIARERAALRDLLDPPMTTPAADPPTAIERALSFVARHWHRLAVVLVVLSVLSRLSGNDGGFLGRAALSVLTLLAAVAVVAGVERLHSLLLGRMEDGGLPHRLALHVGHVLRTAVQVALSLVALVWVLSVWDLAPLDWARGASGRMVLRPVLAIAGAVLAGWLVWSVLDTLLGWSLARHGGTARARTLIPLLRNALAVAVVVLTAIAVLSNLGVDVGPLLAGAGVVGLAIGFGAQSLVKDVITGLFLILEDAIAVGEVVEAAGKSGTVEGLTIRTLRLREGDGSLHSIPFSSVTVLKNASRGHSQFILTVTLATEADVDAALKAVAEVADEVARDPKFSGDVIEPFALWGVDSLGPRGIDIKGAIKTWPTRQWGVGREINRRLKDRLDADGIPLAGSDPLGALAARVRG